jgi:queuine tRNA-ribosyltransferase
MAFDDCPPTVAASRDLAARQRQALDRTTRWLERCREAHQRPDEQALFGIVQGGTDLELRSVSLEAVCNVDLPGYAIGGVAVGESPGQIERVVEFTAPRLPADRPRYLMGVGYERDILAAVRAGVDMFDCVLPTRNGRNANAFGPHGRLHLRNARFRDDGTVIDPGCDCAACGAGHTRAYLRHLFLAGEMLGPILVSLHNLRHYQRLLLDIRRAIREDSWSGLVESWPLLHEESKPCTTSTYKQ